MTYADTITGPRILAIALPVVLSNATVPLQGAVDTAIIGNVGSQAALGGVGIGAAIFSIVFMAFNFLQMGCSGLTAQALGAGDTRRVLNTLARTLVIALTIAVALIALQIPLLAACLGFFDGSAEAQAAASLYFNIRIWGAPFELANYAVLGWFTGQEMTRRVFQHQLVTTLSNITMSVVFGLWFGWGLAGVALATVLANGAGLGYGLWLARAQRRRLDAAWAPDWPRILKREELLRVMVLNRDIFIRTVLLTLSFAWITRLGTQEGELILAVNVVLWQFLAISAYGLDGFAMAAETLVGQAKGAGDRAGFRRAAIRASLWAGGLALLLALLFYGFSAPLIALLTDLPEVREAAALYVGWAAFSPVAGFAAYQLDGIFVGATASKAMRNAMILTAMVYLPLSIWLASAFGNHGIWAAVYAMFLLRAGTMLLSYPAVERSVSTPTA